MKKGIFLFYIFTLFLSACSTAKSDPTPVPSPEELAWSACTLFIDKQLGIDFMDAQRFTPNGVTYLKINQAKVQVYYAKYSSTYECTILYRSDTKSWELQELQVK